jgi:hypothetical protein
MDALELSLSELQAAELQLLEKILVRAGCFWVRVELTDVCVRGRQGNVLQSPDEAKFRRIPLRKVGSVARPTAQRIAAGGGQDHGRPVGPKLRGVHRRVRDRHCYAHHSLRPDFAGADRRGHGDAAALVLAADAPNHMARTAEALR